MSIKFRTEKATTKVEVLMFPSHYVAFPQYFKKDSSLATTVDGRKIIKAGTIYPANDSTAQGIVMDDLDVTDGDQNGAVICHGFIKTSVLPEAPSTNAKAAMKLIEFFPLA